MTQTAPSVILVTVNVIVNVPSRFREAHGFYGISRTQLKPVEQAGLHDALVIVYADRWLEYGALMAGMSPLLDDDIVYARGSGAEIDAEVIGEFPGRTVHYLQGGQLLPAPAE